MHAPARNVGVCARAILSRRAARREEDGGTQSVIDKVYRTQLSAWMEQRDATRQKASEHAACVVAPVPRLRLPMARMVTPPPPPPPAGGCKTSVRS